MKAKVFIDTNVMLDFLGERKGFYQSAAKLISLSDKKKLEMFVSPISLATVNYLLTKYESIEIAIEKLRKFKVLCNISPIDELIIEKGLNSKFKDFEDALQYFCAVESGCDLIITRDGKDFKESKIPVMTPAEYLASIK
ncbi:PIN domain-containing protein [Cryomorpha ignava]|uniref:PIN domain-containing protein n=1 Tax=Cryomorpha ignava TaxID=101383 RepID=A0A7K3WNJ4_9FLAO|nr:PIN domain-containing protein [Cryomorpha ignava]NEN22275.1 PIN domain-containing protein [Cryomorpha ignava]